jgi:hypothetical protein
MLCFTVISSQSVSNALSNLYSMKQELVPFNEQTKEEAHLILNFMTSDKCPYTKNGNLLSDTVKDKAVLEEIMKYFELSIHMVCDPTMSQFEKAKISTNVDEPGFNLCKPKITVKSKFNCSVSRLENVSMFFQEYYWAFAILFITFGAYNIA